MSWVKEEAKSYWGRIALVLIGIAIVFHFAGDIKAFLNKDTRTIIQSNPAPINLSASGLKLPEAPPVYVNVNPVVGEKVTATVVQKKDPKTDPDVVVNDKVPSYKLRYNGKDFVWDSPFVTETSKFEQGQVLIMRESQINVNVEVPQPIWGIGIGKSFRGDYAIQGDVRIAHTPFNVWGYASSKDQAIGIKFVQYGTTSPKKEDKNAQSKN